MAYSKHMHSYMNQRDKQDKKRLIFRIALISSILAIILFSLCSYYGYQYIRYRECRNNMIVLNMYAQGKIDLLEEHSDELTSGNSGAYVLYENLVNTDIYTYEMNEQYGYMKTYKNNVLIEMSIDNSLADFVSYLNPRVWFGGVRNIRSNINYTVRNDKQYAKAYEQLQKIISDKSADLPDNVICVRDTYFMY